MSNAPITCGRLAPSPTGRLHLGNAWAFLCAWLGARSAGGTLLLRIEDIDPQRSQKEYIKDIQHDLSWLGLAWDKAPVLQSERLDKYHNALQKLENAGLVYPCFCSRKELRSLAGAPQAGSGLEHAYTGHCRNLSTEQIEENKRLNKHYSLRLIFGDQQAEHYKKINDLCLGPVVIPSKVSAGDFALCRSDGVFAYQLAVVLDDISMGVTQVVRGEDILSSTPRQLYLYDLFQATPPSYAHIPLLLDHHGERLAKRHHSTAIGYLREAGVKPEDIIGWLAYWSGLRDFFVPVTADALLKDFRFNQIRHDVSRLPERLSDIFPVLTK